MKPIIGITSQNDYTTRLKFNKVNYTYVNAVLEGGGVPLLIPVLESPEGLERYLDALDGIIFTGGGDVMPITFGEDPIKEVYSIDYERDEMEYELFKKAYEKGTPILGICRGLQVANVALGGTLYQDIHVQLEGIIGHESASTVADGYHMINLKKDGLLSKIFNKEELFVNSQHHQSIKDLGRDLKTNATSADGIIEGIESTNDKFLLGFQFHPEAMVKKHKEFVKIFSYFVDVINNRK